jgi:hypothetical protein
MCFLRRGVVLDVPGEVEAGEARGNGSQPCWASHQNRCGHCCIGWANSLLVGIVAGYGC